MINCAGFKVWPAEVEAALHRHRDVQKACVIAMRDTRRGKAVKAIVVRKPGSEIGAAELIAWSRGTMASQMAPQAIDFQAALPCLATGNTAWRQLQEQQRREDDDASPAAPSSLTTSSTP